MSKTDQDITSKNLLTFHVFIVYHSLFEAIVKLPKNLKKFIYKSIFKMSFGFCLELISADFVCSHYQCYQW